MQQSVSDKVDIAVRVEDENLIAQPKGNWVIGQSSAIKQAITRFEEQLPDLSMGKGRNGLVLDLEGLGSIDTAGAWNLVCLARNASENGRPTKFTGMSHQAGALINAIDFDIADQQLIEKPRDNPLVGMAYSVGRLIYTLWTDTKMGLNIIGAAIRGPQMKAGRREGVRFTSIIHHIDRMGIRAVPIVMLMSFLIGAIVSQQSAFQFRKLGLEYWAVDAVGILLLREIGVLLTCIMIAGRSGSAMTAEIGSMKMREEVDAMTVIGLNPIGVLVFPRLVALTISVPLLAFLANMAALTGACLVLRFYSGIGIDEYLFRLRNGIDLSTVFSGLIKAPFMALIIGTMAAVEGLKVEGSAESLGRRTTAAVVKSIFFVIVVDGLFAIFYAAIDY